MSQNKKIKQQDTYWMCIVGPADKNQLSEGCDFPMRDHVKNGFHSVTGSYPNTVSSGWGINNERYELLRTLHVQDTKLLHDALIYIRRKQLNQIKKQSNNNSVSK